MKEFMKSVRKFLKEEFLLIKLNRFIFLVIMDILCKDGQIKR